MASPIVNSLRKVLSPKVSPINKLKINFNSDIKANLLCPTDADGCHHKCSKKLFEDRNDLVEKNVLIEKYKDPINIVSLVKEDSVIPSTNLLLSGTYEQSLKFKVLGKGSFGTVLLAKHQGELTAVKLIFERGQSTMKNEMNGLCLKHQNIVEVLDVIMNSSKKVGLVIMEPFFGESLQNLLDSCVQIPMAEKIKYLLDSGLGLQYCHSHGVLHLDVKPKNILVNLTSKTSKICDFGSSIKKNDNMIGRSINKGTVKYCSPEILKGQQPSEKSDVFSLGITMWQVFYEEIPYDGIDNDVLIYQVVSNNYRPEAGKKYDLIVELEDFELFKKCWEYDPRKRPNMSRVIEELQNMLFQENRSK